MAHREALTAYSCGGSSVCRPKPERIPFQFPKETDAAISGIVPDAQQVRGGTNTIAEAEVGECVEKGKWARSGPAAVRQGQAKGHLRCAVAAGPFRQFTRSAIAAIALAAAAIYLL